MSRWSCLALVVAAGCSGGGSPPAAPAPAVAPAPEDARAARPEIVGEVVFEGMCDASGAVALSSQQLIAADDEDNVLRVYDAERGGAPLSATDISPELGLSLKGKKNPHWPEMDLEAATRLGDHAFWLTSHGRNKKGKLKTERLMFFATTTPRENEPIALVGRGYDALLQDLIDDPRFASFDLAAAAELPPKESGGLNIEGMTASTENDVLIAFRNPIPGGRALIVRLLNPEDVIAADANATARFGDPLLLDLGGQGVRSLSWWRGRYLIVAGEPGEGGVSHLFEWDGAGAPELVELDLAAYNPEGFFTPEDRDEILLLSDDGSVPFDGVACKELDDATARRFRAVRVRLD